MGSFRLVFPLRLPLSLLLLLASAGCTEATRHSPKPVSMGRGEVGWAEMAEQAKTPLFFFNISRHAQPFDSMSYKVHAGEQYNQSCPKKNSKQITKHTLRNLK